MKVLITAVFLVCLNGHSNIRPFNVWTQHNTPQGVDYLYIHQNCRHRNDCLTTELKFYDRSVGKDKIYDVELTTCHTPSRSHFSCRYHADDSGIDHELFGHFGATGEMPIRVFLRDPLSGRSMFRLDIKMGMKRRVDAELIYLPSNFTTKIRAKSKRVIIGL